MFVCILTQPLCPPQLQRAVSVKRLVQEVLEKSPRLQAIPPPKTREVVQWCRHRGYTPPDPEPRRAEEDSIEDILTQIDNEPGEGERERACGEESAIEESHTQIDTERGERERERACVCVCVYVHVCVCVCVCVFVCVV